MKKQLLHAAPGSPGSPGCPGLHGPGVLDPGPSSRDRSRLQQLNSRLAAYLQQVRCLEAANQKLESQILQQLDRKCPSVQRELDEHLRTTSLLQDQISERLSVQSQLQLQLLTAKCHVFNLNIRCEREQVSRGRVEAELQDLRLLREELKTQKLTELQRRFRELTQQIKELHVQHQQNVQGLLAQGSGAVAVEMQLFQSPDLKQQLDHRDRSVMLFNHDQDNCWFNSQMPLKQLCGSRVPMMTFDLPAVSIELQQLRRTAASLQEELKLLQAQNLQLWTWGQQQTESWTLQLQDLHRSEDHLKADLDSDLQVVAQHAADHQDLLDLKGRLENEIQDYRRLLGTEIQAYRNQLDGGSCWGVTDAAAFRSKVTQENIKMVQTKTLTRVRPIRVWNNSPLTSMNRPNLIHESETLRPGPKRETTPINTVVEDKVHVIEPESVSLKETSREVHVKAEEITETFTDAGVKHETRFTPETATAGPGSEVTETESAEPGCIQNQDPAQVVSSGLKTEAEEVRDAGEVVVTGSKVSGSEGGQGEVCWERIRDQSEVGGSMVPELNLNLSWYEEANGSKYSKNIPVREILPLSAENLRSSSLKQTIDVEETDATQLDDLQATNQDPAQDESEVIEEVRDAGEVVVVTGSRVSGSEGGQGKVCWERIRDQSEVGGSMVLELNLNLSWYEEANGSKNIPVREILPLSAENLRSSSLKQTIDVEEIDATQLDDLQATNQDPAQDESEVIEEVRDAGEVVVTGSKVSGSEGGQGEVCWERIRDQSEVGGSMVLELNQDSEISKNIPVREILPLSGEHLRKPGSSSLKQTIDVEEIDASQLDEIEEVRDTSGVGDNEMIEEVESEGSLIVHHSLSCSDETNSKQNDSNDIPVREILPVSAETCSDSEDEVPTVDPKLFNETTVVGRINLDVEERSIMKTEINTTEGLFPDTKPVTVIGGQVEPGSGSLKQTIDVKKIDATQLDQVQAKNQDPAQDESLKLETAAEEVRGTGGVVVRGSEGNNKIREESEVETLIDHQSFSYKNNSKQNNMKDADVMSDPAVWSCNDKTITQIVTETLKVESEVSLVTDGENVSSPTDSAASCESVMCSIETDERLVHPETNLRQNDNEVGEKTEDETGQSQTKVTPDLRPEEKPVLWTKEDDWSFRSRYQALLEVDRNRSVNPSVSSGSESFSVNPVHGSDQRESFNKQRNSDCLVDSCGKVPVPGGSAASLDANGASTIGGDTAAESRSSGSRLPSEPSEESSLKAKNQPATGRFGKAGSGEWMVYGGVFGRKKSLDANVSLANTGSEDGESAASRLPTNPPGTGRIGSAGSGEWRVYGGSAGRRSLDGSTERVRVSAGGSLGGRDRCSRSPWKHSSSLGRDGRSGERLAVKDGTTRRTHSPAERRRVSRSSGGSSGGRGPNRISTAGGGANLSSSGSGERLNSRGPGAGGVASPRLGRAFSAGGRVITSSDGPIRSTGSGAGANRERISVCKMAAMSMAVAAGRGRSQEKERRGQTSRQHDAAASPLIQRWLTTADQGAEPEAGGDDIIRP